MPDPNINLTPKDNYDPRWFIWTIVFLLITGVSLVSYILLSDTGSVDASGTIIVHRAAMLKK